MLADTAGQRSAQPIAADGDYSVASPCGACESVRVTLAMVTPTVADLPDVIDTMASWQREGSPTQVHPGDLGWYERFGAEALAAALRIWARDGDLVAVGFLDESELVRMAIAPDAGDDHDIANRIADDFVDTLDDVLPPGESAVEARFGSALRRVLTDRGWTAGDPWTELRRDLTPSVPTPPLHIRVVGPELVEDRVMVHVAAFPRSTLTSERWHQMADGPAYRNAHCLIGYDENGAAVASATAWSAGPDRPGLIEPLGVHGDHRGRGYGVAITLAAADAMRRMGCSSATVATPSSNSAAVATYQAAGFVASGDVNDFCRP